MSSNIVVDLLGSSTGEGVKSSILGFRSILPSSTITGTQENPDYPFINAIDFRDNTKYSPSISSGTFQIVMNQSSLSEIDYFAFAIHNSQQSGLSGFFEVDSGSGYETVAEFSLIKTNRPFLKSFTSRNSQRQRLTLSFTSQLFIGSINIGKSVVFSRTPSLGFQPGRTASLDEVEQFTTEGNNFIVGRRINRGFQSTGTFRYIEFKNQIDDWFEEYMNHVLDSKTLYFKWDDLTDETVYALQNPRTLVKPSYVTSFHSDISFEFNGYA